VCRPRHAIPRFSRSNSVTSSGEVPAHLAAPPCGAPSGAGSVDLPRRAVFLGIPLPLKVLSHAAAAVLDELTANLDVGDSHKIDRGTVYMSVHVECLHGSGLGLLYSIAQYYEQNGDLLPDPDVVFVRAAAGWSPSPPRTPRVPGRRPRPCGRHHRGRREGAGRPRQLLQPVDEEHPGAAWAVAEEVSLDRASGGPVERRAGDAKIIVIPA